MYAKLQGMVGAILLLCGLVAVSFGGWRGYRAASAALVRLLREGDETRSRIDATRPVHERARVRVAARHVALALMWIAVALYGAYLLATGVAVLG